MQREEMPCDVLFVGAGPACLSGAIHLMDLVQRHNDGVAAGTVAGAPLDPPMVVVIEKGSQVGAHQLSGAVVDPITLNELVPDWRAREDFPVERFVEREEMVYLTPTRAVASPWIPPELHNHGKPIVSLGRLCQWLSGIAEAKGVNVLPGFTGVDLLWDGDTCAGVRTGDKGIGKDGQPKDNFEPGMNLTARVTVLGEGPRGHLARRLIQRRQLDADSQPMIYELGVKEILELPPGTVRDGWVVHTLGWPLDGATFGGSFLYSLGGDRVCVGLLVALDAHDPQMDAHLLLQHLKTHPYVKEKLAGGKVVKYGAKAVTIGGWASMPQLYTDGAMLVGDSASFLNPMRVKGVHLSMKSGMLAAEAAFEALLRKDASAATLSTYKTRLDASFVRAEMEPAKNMHANFAGGFVGGMVRTGVQYLFGPGPLKKFDADFHHVSRKGHRAVELPKLDFDGKYLVDKLTDVYHSGTVHEEQQPAHLKIVDTEICATTCLEQYGNPCTRFCPAQVYNLRPNEKTGRSEMEVDFANCVHCKTCDIRDPYQIITWMPPEGGNGPEYGAM
ncbi:MAG: electron transfer flavoprotein-ubiquinone oxidoreductase [Myxococcota bacterium]